MLNKFLKELDQRTKAFESNAKEATIHGPFFDQHFEEEYVMDQDGMYLCKDCGARLDTHNIQTNHSPEEVARHHMETEHGLTESKAIEDIFDETEDPDWEEWKDDDKGGTVNPYTGEPIDEEGVGWGKTKKSKEIDTLDSISQAEYDKEYDELDLNEKEEVNSIMDDPWQGESKANEYEGEDEPEYHDMSNVPEEAEEDLTEKDIADYYESQDKETEGDDQELLDFYASQSDEAKEHDVEISEPATEYELEIETEEEDGLEPEDTRKEKEFEEREGIPRYTTDEEPDIGATEDNGQAGNIWTCPECGFKSISKDEYDVHNSKHGNIPATVGSPLSEENIAVQHSDYQILSRFQ